MSEYTKNQADKHKVMHEISGKIHFFKVITEKGEEHSVSIQAGCDCKYMGVQGISNGEICSHILATLKLILETGNIKLNGGFENLIQLRRNACRKLVRNSNVILNEVRTSSGESSTHRLKKEEVCKKLKQEGKHYITEAIFDKGGRADILVLDDFKAIEIVHTETDASIEKKRAKYPDGIKIQVIRC